MGRRVEGEKMLEKYEGDLRRFPMGLGGGIAMLAWMVLGNLVVEGLSVLWKIRRITTRNESEIES